MKNLLKTLSILMLSLVVIVSCSRDDDPADNDFFAGTYNGSISFIDGSNNINTADGKVFVTKIASGTKYNFKFSNGIPELNGIEFQQTGDNTLVSVGSTGTSYIKIDNNDLEIFYTKDGKTWTADCTR
ncbi:hypothetical protein J8J42_03230 [Chryseobacterium sp. cx-311]|uniref:hypothetical protein n=1 Tax=Marnyiella aurantia TaxID=2758037 RepID=UPI001AE78D04|nr:hypothetical protein [Marnyiella aurantia]MBP0612058.1 hypothetical protein [Marnyiella aurantia]